MTAYACEDNRLNISCGNELYLDIIRANYGRFSITICNEHGNTDWKVDCQAGRTLRAMQARYYIFSKYARMKYNLKRLSLSTIYF